MALALLLGTLGGAVVALVLGFSLVLGLLCFASLVLGAGEGFEALRPLVRG